MENKKDGIAEDLENGAIKLAIYNIQKEFRIYHIGVLVRGREFHYGMRIGVFACEPMNQRKTFHVKYCRKMVQWKIDFMRYVGMLKDFPLQTSLTLAQMEAVKRELSQKYTQHNYHLLNHNCIDFAREFIRRIAIKQPPSGCWPQEIRQPLIILPIRLILRIDERKALRKEKKIREVEGGNAWHVAWKRSTTPTTRKAIVFPWANNNSNWLTSEYTYGIALRREIIKAIFRMDF